MAVILCSFYTRPELEADALTSQWEAGLSHISHESYFGFDALRRHPKIDI
jgi:hypothetical protein